jgi:hypothetical protein
MSITDYARRLHLSKPGARSRLRKLVGLCPRCGRPRWDGAVGAGCTPLEDEKETLG